MNLFLRIRLLTLAFSISGLLLFVLCIGSQNLRERKRIDFGISSSAPFPTGFIVGASIVLGFFSGSATTVFLMPEEIEDKDKF